MLTRTRTDWQNVTMTDPDGALFPAPEAPAGPMRLAMAENIEQWQAAGRALSPALTAALLAQAEAIDLAGRSGKATQVSGANRVLTDMMVAFHLVADVPGKTSEGLADFLAKVEAAANAADDG